MEHQHLRVAIVHRDGLYRDSLGQCLTQTEPISIIYSSSRFDELMEVVAQGMPDLLIVEFGLCRMQKSGRAFPLSAESDRVKTIVIGVPDREEDVLACIEREGASGYLLIDASLEDLLLNIRAVMKGETLCSPRIAALAFGRISRLSRQAEVVEMNQARGLTRRETEIVRLIEDGLSNKEIATQLNIGVSTVKNHVHNILDKLQLPSRYSAVKCFKEQAVLTGSH